MGYDTMAPTIPPSQLRAVPQSESLLQIQLVNNFHQTFLLSSLVREENQRN